MVNKKGILDKKMKQTILKKAKNKSTDNTFEFAIGQENRLRVNLIREDVVRFQSSYNGTFPGSGLNRYGFIHNIQNKFKVQKLENKNEIVLETSKIQIVLNKNPLGIAIKDKKGNILLKRTKETIPEGKDGFKITFDIKPKEEFFGFGDQTRSYLTQRGKKADLWIKNVASYLPIPFFMSTYGYGMMVNTTYRHRFDMGSANKKYFTIQCEKGAMDFYFFYGPSLGEILFLYTELTGKPSLPPIWSFGLWFICRTHANDSEVINDCLNFRREKIPCDVIGLEPGWMSEYYDYSTKKEWHPERFPMPDYAKNGPHTMISAIKRMGFKLELWECNDYDLTIEAERQVQKGTDKNRDINTSFDSSTDYQPVWSKDGEIDKNFSHPVMMDKITVAGESWFEHHKQPIDQGVDFFKQDGSNQVLPHPDRLWGNGMIDDEAHNLYPLIYSKQMYEGFREYAKRRPCCFTPTGWAGVQHYTGTWTGDTGGGEKPLVAILNMSLCGHAWTTCDMEVTTPEGIHFGFLQAWSQLNSWNYWRHPWFLGDKLYSIFKFYANLRSSLIPYVYSYAYIASQTGIPIVRPMVLEFPEDISTYNLLKQYMLGKEFLVCTFTDKVYLPEGKWMDYWTGKIYTGGRTVRYTAPSNRGGGFFMRSGAIVPKGPIMNYVGQVPTDKIYLEIFPEAGDGEFLLYEDDGISLEHENGKFATTLFKYKIVKESLSMSIGERKGGYENMPRERQYRLKVFKRGSPNFITRDSLELKLVSSKEQFDENEDTWWYNDRENFLLINTKRLPCVAMRIKIQYKGI